MVERRSRLVLTDWHSQRPPLLLLLHVLLSETLTALRHAKLVERVDFDDAAGAWCVALLSVWNELIGLDEHLLLLLLSARRQSLRRSQRTERTYLTERVAGTAATLAY